MLSGEDYKNLLTTNWKYRTYQGMWTALDWLFPPICGGCGVSGTRWCLECRKKIRSIPDPICETCGLPQARIGACSKCHDSHPSYKALRSWAIFESPVQNALHRLKYRRDIGLGEMLASQMLEFVRGLGWPLEIIVPIPLGRKRLKERGYNQVAMVALPLSMQLGLKYYPDALVRAKETRSQVGLSAVERQENVRYAFQANTNKVKGRTVLLVDDVATTGATLSSAADALYISGARDVYAVTIARALSHVNGTPIKSL